MEFPYNYTYSNFDKQHKTCKYNLKRIFTEIGTAKILHMVNFKIPIKVDYMAIITGTLGVDNRFDKCSGSGSCRRKLAMNTAITQLDVFCVLGFQFVLVATRTLYVPTYNNL